MSLPVAAIDFGTNTARLLIAKRDSDGRLIHLSLNRMITRLGGGFTPEVGLSPEARRRGMSALQYFAEEIARYGATKVRAVATSAVRDAANGTVFIEEAALATGIRLETIDGEEEGLLTLKGVHAGLDIKSGSFMIFDIGGGSTEYTVAEEDRPLYTRSLPLGVVRLTEGKGTVDAMSEKIARELASLKEDLEKEADIFSKLKDATLVGTAGTVTTLAAIFLQMDDYDYRKVNNLVLDVGEIREIYQHMLPLTPEERLRIPGLEKGREDLIIAGTLLTLKTMDLFGFQNLKVSDFGLLEGLALTLVLA